METTTEAPTLDEIVGRICDDAFDAFGGHPLFAPTEFVGEAHGVTVTVYDEREPDIDVVSFVARRDGEIIATGVMGWRGDVDFDGF